MSDDEKSIAQLEQKLSQTRALLTHMEETLQEERRQIAANKNKVPGGYYMMSRKAEKNLREIQRESPTAALVFSVIREHMQMGTNALTISQAALCKILGVGRTTVYRATKYLTEKHYVQLIKTGNVTTFVVNEQVAFAGNPGQRKAVFSTTLVAHECEQDEGWDKVTKLKAVPVIYDDERPILGSENLPPPDQADLELN